jgi:hypothetical protein
LHSPSLPSSLSLPSYASFFSHRAVIAKTLLGFIISHLNSDVMSGPGGINGPGGNSGPGGNGAISQQIVPATTSSAQHSAPTTAAAFLTTTAADYTIISTPTGPPTSTSTSASSSSATGVNKALIGGLVGGLGGLLVISLLAIWWLQRRKNKRIAEKNGMSEPVTYAGLNQSMSGVPFVNAADHNYDNIPPPPFYSSRGGEVSPVIGRDSGDFFLPTYADSVAGISSGGVSSLGSSNISHVTSSVAPVSPISISRGNPAAVISPQTTGYTGAAEISPQTTDEPAVFQALPSRDTTSFPTTPEEIDRQITQTPTIISPVPRHPLVHQDSLERVVQQGLVTTPGFPERDSSRLDPRTRILSQEMLRESPVLGDLSAVRMMQGSPVSYNNTEVDVERNPSQRTVSSVSSMGVSVVSDGELERSGIGAIGRQ